MRRKKKISLSIKKERKSERAAKLLCNVRNNKSMNKQCWSRGQTIFSLAILRDQCFFITANLIRHLHARKKQKYKDHGMKMLSD